MPFPLSAGTDYIIAIFPITPAVSEWSWNESVFPSGLPGDFLTNGQMFPNLVQAGVAGFDVYGIESGP